MTTLAELETKTREILARNAAAEKAKEEREEAEYQASVERMRQAMVAFFSEELGLDPDEADAIITTEVTYDQTWSAYAKLTLPNCPDVPVRVEFSAEWDQAKLADEEPDALILTLARTPFSCKGYTSKTAYFATLGEAIVAARDRQQQEWEWEAQQEAEDRTDAQDWAREKAAKASVEQARVAYLRELIETYPFIWPFLHSLSRYIQDIDALQHDLDAAVDFEAHLGEKLTEKTIQYERELDRLDREREHLQRRVWELQD